MTTAEAPPATLRRLPIIGWWRDPWRKPRLLAALAWTYVAWTLLPVAMAIGMSFNSGRSNAVWQGFSFQWWWGHPVFDPQGSLFVDPELHAAIFQSLRLSILATAVAVPLGVCFAIGLDRWHGRPAAGANLLMMLSFILPEIIGGVAMFMVFTFLLKFIHLGTVAQLLGLITFEISYPVIIVRARLLSIDKDVEDAAMDLGASPTQAVRRVLLPLLYPAIFASAALVFAGTIDDFITVRYLSGSASSEPLAVKIYNFSRGTPTPAMNAATTFMLLSTLVVVAVALAGYLRVTRGQRQEANEAIGGALF